MPRGRRFSRVVHSVLGGVMAKRRQNFQPISWFWDLKRRELLNMDPPYQRRSVWNDRYREQFIDTILLDYPVPAVFLFARVSDSGDSDYELVDGKQRLTTVFDFVQDKFPVSEQSEVAAFRGRYFTSFSSDDKVAFFEYDFPVEYLPTNNEQVINNIFDRLNRNTAKLTFQELRHARFNGEFITHAENMATWMEKRFERAFPRITEQSKRQMKDVEIVASLLLFLEEGPKGYSAIALDEAFASRDSDWESADRVTEEFKRVIDYLAQLFRLPEGQFIPQSRFRNQADFYSLFGAIAELTREGKLPEDQTSVAKLLGAFLEILENESMRDTFVAATVYYEGARSASNDPGARRKRIAVMKLVITGGNLAIAP